MKAREKKSWFGFGTEATVHVWGKPALDQENQILRLTDISLAVESEAAFGLLGTAARAAMPYVQKALADKAVIDLKPFANDARTKIAAALTEFQQVGNGVRVDAAVNGPASHRHRVRHKDAARDRGSKRHRESCRDAIAQDVAIVGFRALVTGWIDGQPALTPLPSRIH